ncbi:hypothetical protein OH77DRAFT_895491 [Trametes cingulata]|nr:hypothetical protein OH77DRAFT_895491 [Trametes cingulata]
MAIHIGAALSLATPKCGSSAHVRRARPALTGSRPHSPPYVQNSVRGRASRSVAPTLSSSPWHSLRRTILILDECATAIARNLSCSGRTICPTSNSVESLSNRAVVERRAVHVVTTAMPKRHHDHERPYQLCDAVVLYLCDTRAIAPSKELRDEPLPAASGQLQMSRTPQFWTTQSGSKFRPERRMRHSSKGARISDHSLRGLPPSRR